MRLWVPLVELSADKKHYINGSANESHKHQAVERA